MKGLIHIYTGEGKGKTTAATGLAVRFAGSGGKVLFTQFLKDGHSGEIEIMDSIKNITCLLPDFNFGFTWNMTDEEKVNAKNAYSAYLEDVFERAGGGHYGLLILDEVIGADNSDLIPHSRLINFLKHRPESLEVVLTGRGPSEDILKLADYISEINCIRHPYQRGIPARRGIEL